MRPVLAQLKERKLVQWGVAYLAGAWLLLQVVSLLGEPFAWPPLILRAAAVLLAVGFFAALVIAWYHGERGAQRVSGVELLMLTGIMAIAGSAVAFVRDGPGKARAHPDAVAEQGSIAVLPFADLSREGDQRYFTDGLTEELINVLSQLPELRVASRTSAFAYQGSHVPLDSIARALRVAHVLEGSVRREGDRIRITAQLISAGDGYHIWSAAYDRRLDSIFAVQDEIAHAIVRALELRLGERATERLAKEETRDGEAHALVLEGGQLTHEGGRASMEKAIELLQQAIARDSTYATPWAELASVYVWQNYLSYGKRDVLAASARNAARRALALDPRLAEAEEALGRIAADIDWDFRAAEAHFNRAIELNPGLASAHSRQAWLHAQLGRFDEAIRGARRAVELDPIQPGVHGNLGVMYYYAGQLDSAVQAYRVALALAEDPGLLVNLAITYSHLGRHGDAIAAAERAFELEPLAWYPASTLAFVHGRAGHQPEALAVIRRLENRRPSNPYSLALAYAGLGNRERERVITLLEGAFAERDPGLLDLGVEPVFAEYRDDPRIAALLKRLGLR